MEEKLSDVELAVYALSFVEREFKFTGIDEVNMKITREDGAYETINVVETLGKALSKLFEYEEQERLETELSRQILKGVN